MQLIKDIYKPAN